MPSIVGAFPYTIANGQTEDATVVMALFSYIQSQVNSNACPKTTGSAILKGDGAGGTTSAVAGTDFLGVAPGMVFDFAGTVAPTGYLECDGSAVSRTTYAGLFTAIGTTWGAGDGSTTFNLPNFARKTRVGRGGAGTGTLGNTVGSVGGEETHILTVAELASHSHTTTDPSHTHGVTDPTHVHNTTITRYQGAGGADNSNYGASSATVINTAAAATGISINAASTGVSINNTGSSSGHNIMQPSAVVMTIIKT